MCSSSLLLPPGLGGGFVLNAVVKREKEGQHLEAPEFFEFESPVVNVQEQQPQQQQQQQLVVVVNAVLFVFVSLLVLPRNCASCQVFPFAEKPLRLFFAQPIGEKN